MSERQSGREKKTIDKQTDRKTDRQTERTNDRKTERQKKSTKGFVIYFTKLPKGLDSVKKVNIYSNKIINLITTTSTEFVTL